MNLFGVAAFTEAADSSVRFTSRVDNKGRVLVCAKSRKALRLKFGSPVEVEIGGQRFSTKVDERGRFSVQSEIRKNSAVIQGEVRRCQP